MKFRVDYKIFDKFPQLIIGIIIAKNIDNTGESEEISKRMKRTLEGIREDMSLEMITKHPKMTVWQDAYRLFGAKDKTCSVENLYRMILEGKDIRHINKLVDIYNFASIDNMVPIGGDDLGKVDGDIMLTFAKGDEKFIELGKSEEVNPKAGEVIYRDRKEVLCRRWNWRECEKTKITESTRNVALVIEGLPPTDKDEIVDIMGAMATFIENECGGDVIRYNISASNPEIEINL
jgi:lysyl-tRNA synthetase class 2